MTFGTIQTTYHYWKERIRRERERERRRLKTGQNDGKNNNNTLNTLSYPLEKSKIKDFGTSSYKTLSISKSWRKTKKSMIIIIIIIFYKFKFPEKKLWWKIF